MRKILSGGLPAIQDASLTQGITEIIRSATMTPTDWVVQRELDDPDALEKLEVDLAKELASSMGRIAEAISTAGEMREVQLMVHSAVADFVELANLIQPVDVPSSQAFVRFIVRILDKAIWFSGLEDPQAVEYFQGLSAHSRGVVLYAAFVAQKRGLSPSAIRRLKLAAALHDMGKMGVRPSILYAQRKLSEDEVPIMRRHPDIAYCMLEKIPWLRGVADIVVTHHVNKGYPERLVGMPLTDEMKILNAMEVYDALRQKARKYRDAPFTHDDAIKEMVKEGCDPEISELIASVTDTEIARVIPQLLERWEAEMFWPALRELVTDRFLPNIGGRLNHPVLKELFPRRAEIWFLTQGRLEVGDGNKVIEWFWGEAGNLLPAHADVSALGYSKPDLYGALLVFMYRVQRINSKLGGSNILQRAHDYIHANIDRPERLMAMLQGVQDPIADDQSRVRHGRWLIGHLYADPWGLPCTGYDDATLFTKFWSVVGVG